MKAITNMLELACHSTANAKLALVCRGAGAGLSTFQKEDNNWFLIEIIDKSN